MPAKVWHGDIAAQWNNVRMVTANLSSSPGCSTSLPNRIRPIDNSRPELAYLERVPKSRACPPEWNPCKVEI
jgi:hypothetical protein